MLDATVLTMHISSDSPRIRKSLTSPLGVHDRKMLCHGEGARVPHQPHITSDQDDDENSLGDRRGQLLLVVSVINGLIGLWTTGRKKTTAP